MPGYFLDTSAIVKRYHVEAGTQFVDKIVADQECELSISRIGFIEVLSAIQLSIALDLKSQARIGEFVCADQVLCEVAIRENLPTLNPFAVPSFEQAGFVPLLA